MNIFSDIINFLKDGSLSFGRKSLVLIFLLLIFLAANYYFGFSFNYMINQELNQIDKIAKIRKEYVLNDTLKNELTKVENEIIQKHNLLKNTFSTKILKLRDTVLEFSIDTQKFADTSKIVQTAEDIKAHEIDSNEISLRERNWIVDLITSSYGFLLILMLLPFIPFFNIKDFWMTLLGAIIFMVIDIGLIWLNYKLFILIPTIKYLWINYMINILLHTGFIIAIVLISVRISQKNK